MTKKLPAPTAKDINDAHLCAKESAENAVEWAMKCGKLLSDKKDSVKASVGHGTWESWVEENCEFSLRMAQRYMQAAKSDTRDAFGSLRQALGYDKPKPKQITNTPKGAVSVVNPEGGRTTAAKEGTEETGNDRPAAPVFDSAPAPKVTEKQQFKQELPQKTAETTPAPTNDERWVPDEDEDEKLALAEKEYNESIDKVMESDDKLAAARTEIKRQAAEIATLRISRDGYMNGKLAVTKMLKAEQRKVERLTAELNKLRTKDA